MKEKNFQTEFKEKNSVHGVFELKLCKGRSLPFDAVADHQEEALLCVHNSDGHYHKISDQPVSWGGNRFTKPKPFDCFYLKNTPAYVVIMFYEPRKKKNAYYLPIASWVTLKISTTDRKSATEEMVERFAEIKVNYLSK